MQCDMCGSETELFKAEIEGTTLNVCRSCAKYGKIKSPVRKPGPVMKSKTRKKVPEKVIIKDIVDDFASLIKNAREKKGLMQKELAKKIAERESIIQKLETGSLKPSFRLAKKLENNLGIKLIYEYEEESDVKFSSDKSAMTIGDILLMKKK